MPWLNHPAYVRVRDDLIRRLKHRTYVFKYPRPVVFLCGGSGSTHRPNIAAFLRKHAAALVFYADEVWLQISSQTGANALAMEADLAELADIVMIVVESPGTFAELGAFALSPPLREKLLPILDKRYRQERSFINTGPVRWVDAQSLFSPSIHADFVEILDSAPDLAARIGRLPKRTSQLVRGIDLAKSKKNLLFFIIGLISVIGPVTQKHVHYYVEGVIGPYPEGDLESLLGLAYALRQVSKSDVPGVGTVLYRPAELVAESTAIETSGISLPTDRARMLSVLQRIDPALAALKIYEDPL